MLPAALQAREATVVLAIDENAQVDALARLLHRLRRERGNALKLVVRELQPCPSTAFGEWPGQRRTIPSGRR